jgi:copper chaperone
LRLTINSLSDTSTGVTEFDVSLEEQKVTVTGTMPYEDVLEKIKKTGKKVNFNLYDSTFG